MPKRSEQEVLSEISQVVEDIEAEVSRIGNKYRIAGSWFTAAGDGDGTHVSFRVRRVSCARFREDGSKGRWSVVGRYKYETDDRILLDADMKMKRIFIRSAEDFVTAYHAEARQFAITTKKDLETGKDALNALRKLK